MRTGDTALGDLLFGRRRGILLATLYDKPDSSFFVRQLARHIDGSAGMSAGAKLGHSAPRERGALAG
jgi:hypothetical protein